MVSPPIPTLPPPRLDMSQCHRYASILAPLKDSSWSLFFLFVFFFSSSLVMTQITRACIPAATAPAQTATTPAATEGESTSIPAPDMEAGLLAAEGEQPPPYQPSASVRGNPAYTVPEIPPFAGTPATATTAPPNPPPPAPPTTVPQLKLSSARLFVVGSACTVFNLFSLAMLALVIQTILFCVWGRLDDTPTSVTYWVLFSGPAIFATFGLTCWAMLFRDLFGKRVAKKYPFPEYLLLKYLAIVGLGPLIVLAIAGTMVGMVCIAALERCQGRWCPDAVDEVESGSEDGNGGREEVGLVMGNIDVGAGNEVEIERQAEEEGSGSQVRDEERVGLIQGAEKS